MEVTLNGSVNGRFFRQEKIQTVELNVIEIWVSSVTGFEVSKHMHRGFGLFIS